MRVCLKETDEGYSMMLINSLMAHASDAQWEEFIGEIERLNVRKAVIVRSPLPPFPLLAAVDMAVDAASHGFPYD